MFVCLKNNTASGPILEETIYFLDTLNKIYVFGLGCWLDTYIIECI